MSGGETYHCRRARLKRLCTVYLDVDGGQGVGGGGAVVQHGVVQVAENVLQEEKKEE